MTFPLGGIFSPRFKRKELSHMNVYLLRRGEEQSLIVTTLGPTFSKGS